MRCRLESLVLLGLFGLPAVVGGQVARRQQECPPPVQGTGTIVGVVREEATQVPMGFVDVRLIPASSESGGLVQVTRSAPNGRFQFCNVPTGPYTVQGWFDEIGGDLTRVSVGPGGTTTMALNLSLKAESDQPGTLSGRVLDAESREPIEGATVEVDGRGRRVITNQDGRFTVPSLRPGNVEMIVSHLAYEPATGQVEVGGAQTVTVEVVLATRVIELEPITVTATRRDLQAALPGMEELDRRMASGFGEFILSEDIRQRNPGRVTDLLQGSAGIQVMLGGRAIYGSRTQCAPVVYIDDVRITHGTGATNLRRDSVSDFLRGTPDDDEGVFAAEAVNLIHPQHIQAIEIYPGPGSTPGQYLDSRSRCGVILIWTRRGPRGNQ